MIMKSLRGFGVERIPPHCKSPESLSFLGKKRSREKPESQEKCRIQEIMCATVMFLRVSEGMFSLYAERGGRSNCQVKEGEKNEFFFKKITLMNRIQHLFRLPTKWEKRASVID